MSHPPDDPRRERPVESQVSLPENDSQALAGDAEVAGPPPSASLAEAVEKVGLELESHIVERLEEYCHLLWDANQSVNLTRHSDYDTFASRDVMDSWQVSKLIPSESEVLDIGSGGGVPGIPLAIMRDDLQVHCVDSVGKKIGAIEQFVQQLELPVPIFHCRAEDLLQDLRFDYSIARAVGPMWKLGSWFAGNWIALGKLLAIKGPRYSEELEEAREKQVLLDAEVNIVARYLMPNSQIESVILEISAKKST